MGKLARRLTGAILMPEAPGGHQARRARKQEVARAVEASRAYLGLPASGRATLAPRTEKTTSSDDGWTTRPLGMVETSISGSAIPGVSPSRSSSASHPTWKRTRSFGLKRRGRLVSIRVTQTASMTTDAGPHRNLAARVQRGAAEAGTGRAHAAQYAKRLVAERSTVTLGL